MAFFVAKNFLIKVLKYSQLSFTVNSLIRFLENPCNFTETQWMNWTTTLLTEESNLSSQWTRKGTFHYSNNLSDCQATLNFHVLLKQNCNDEDGVQEIDLEDVICSICLGIV